MCGITGVFTKTGVPASVVADMNKVITHRGPDDEGYFYHGENADIYCGGVSTPVEVYKSDLSYTPQTNNSTINTTIKVGLGHRRLSILDLSSSGHQPMSTEDNGMVMVYNGEIYNYKTLRDQLSLSGYNFRSNSDTEVLLKGYHLWGKAVLERLNGMFAFIIWDRNTNRLFAARDRFGIKPLYYYQDIDKTIYIASEIKQFSQCPNWRAKINLERANDYLRWAQTDHTVETMFDSVYQLRGGEYMDVDLANNNIHPQRYYNLESNLDRYAPLSDQEAVRYFKKTLTESVEMRLNADVQVGTCLSGGLDSSSIATLANGIINKGRLSATDVQHTFSSCSHIDKYDERKYVEKVVQMRGVKSHYVYPDSNTLLKEISEIIWHHDEPFLSTSVFAEWSVFNLVRKEGIKVTLDGHGADEILGGYSSFYGPVVANHIRSLKMAALLRELSGERTIHNHKWGEILTRSIICMLPERLKNYAVIQSRRKHRAELVINDEYLDSRRVPRSVLNNRSSSLQMANINQLLFSSVPKQLKWADRDSMKSSVESRVPFLDHRVVELSIALKPQLKINAGTTKQVLRQSMNGILPDEIVNRQDKMGFVTPEQHWMQNESPAKFKKLLGDSIEKSRGLLSSEDYELACRVIDSSLPFSRVPWRAICFGAWMDSFNVEI